MTAIPPVSNLFLVSYTKSNAVRSSADSSGCQKSMITTYLSSRDLLSGRKNAYEKNVSADSIERERRGEGKKD